MRPQLIEDAARADFQHLGKRSDCLGVLHSVTAAEPPQKQRPQERMIESARLSHVVRPALVAAKSIGAAAVCITSACRCATLEAGESVP
jgi:hypothetical protein